MPSLNTTLLGSVSLSIAEKYTVEVQEALPPFSALPSWASSLEM